MEAAVYNIRNLALLILLCYAAVCHSSKALCPDDRHHFTNCSNPCRQGDNMVYCASNPAATCKPDYCGGCVPRFKDQQEKEVRCTKEEGVICEMKTHTIKCTEANKVIAVTWANYGRTSPTICEHPFGTEKLHGDTNCRAVDSISVVKRLCHGKKTCTITVENTLFQKDPCYGVYKYLEVEFECVAQDLINRDGYLSCSQNVHVWVMTTILASVACALLNAANVLCY